MNEAIKKSEEFHIEQAMLDDKLKATDWEATNDEIMELVARESYIQWIKDNEKRHNFLHTDTVSLNPSSATCSSWDHEPKANLLRPLSRRSAAAMSTPPHSPSQTKFSNHFKTSPQSNKSMYAAADKQQKYHHNQPIYDDPYSGPAYPSISSASAGISMDKSLSSKSSDPSKSSSHKPHSSINPMPPPNGHSSSLISQDIYDESMPLAYQFYETKSIMNERPPDVFGLGSNEWTEPSLASDSDILASVLAASQQEYLESLKAKRQQQS